MVRVAIAGGSGQIASEIADVLSATGRHEVLLLTRNNASVNENRHGVSWATADYTDTAGLTKILKDVHTVLSFIYSPMDVQGEAQRNLIDSSMAAGVKRFAPSEWSTKDFEELPWYLPKLPIRDYLAEINKDKKVLEYTHFQPGMMLDCLVPVGSSTSNVRAIELPVDFARRRAMVLQDKDALITLTTVNDMAQAVLGAIEYQGEWPLIGGIRGTTMTTSKFLEIATKARGGKPWDISYLKEADLRAGKIDTSWTFKLALPGLPDDQVTSFSEMVLKGLLLSGLHSAWAVSDEWNQLLPNFKPIDAEEFLKKHWAGVA